MAQDSDVARVAAALNTPGLRYRSFGNEPVRVRPAPPVVVEEVFPEALEPEFAPESEFLPESAPESMAEPELPPLPPLNFEPLPEPPPVVAAAPVEPPPAPEPPPPPPPPQPEPPVLRPAAPEPVSAPLFSWPETTPVAAPPAPSLLPEVASSYAAQPKPAASFRLLEAIGMNPEEQAAATVPAPQGGTLALLRSAVAEPAAAPQEFFRTGGAQPQVAPASPLGSVIGLLPAAAVTVPLSDVMRLVAGGSAPLASPFDAFRAALGAQPQR
ncbi:hypothetical protein [Rhodovarius lipocyclicus]|uniref:hypothetical protein n=1 Tax=Rhodovarius lipocyclicus TaxID=268410 RepID=UPI00135B5E71|nr:hypothetical protein [Rhodovarius lipocyclicus]